MSEGGRKERGGDTRARGAGFEVTRRDMSGGEGRWSAYLYAIARRERETPAALHSCRAASHDCIAVSQHHKQHYHRRQRQQPQATLSNSSQRNFTAGCQSGRLGLSTSRPMDKGEAAMTPAPRAAKLREGGERCWVQWWAEVESVCAMRCDATLPG